MAKSKRAESVKSKEITSINFCRSGQRIEFYARLLLALAVIQNSREPQISYF